MSKTLKYLIFAYLVVNTILMVRMNNKIKELQEDREIIYQMVKSLTSISSSNIKSLKMINDRVDLAWEVLEN